MNLTVNPAPRRPLPPAPKPPASTARNPTAPSPRKAEPAPPATACATASPPKPSSSKPNPRRNSPPCSTPSSTASAPPTPSSASWSSPWPPPAGASAASITIESTILDNELMRREDSIDANFTDVDNNDLLAHAFQCLSDNGRVLANLAPLRRQPQPHLRPSLQAIDSIAVHPPPTPPPVTPERPWVRFVIRAIRPLHLLPRRTCAALRTPKRPRPSPFRRSPAAAPPRIHPPVNPRTRKPAARRRPNAIFAGRFSSRSPGTAARTPNPAAPGSL